MKILVLLLNRLKMRQVVKYFSGSQPKWSMKAQCPLSLLRFNQCQLCWQWHGEWFMRPVGLFWACDLFLIRSPWFSKGVWCLELFTWSSHTDSHWTAWLLHSSFSDSEHINIYYTSLGDLGWWQALPTESNYKHELEMHFQKITCLCLLKICDFSSVPAWRNSSAEQGSTQHSWTAC